MSNPATGPRTDEGKARSSQNATKHGLRTDRPVTPGEDAAEWEAFRDAIVSGRHPATDEERELAERIARQYWRLRRLDRFETQSITDAMDTAGRHMAYTLTGVYTEPQAQVCKSTWETKQQYVDELNLVPKAQEAVAQLHNLPAETAIDPDAGWLLRSLFRDDVERQPVTAGVLRRDLQTLTQKPLAQALRLTAEKLEVRRKELEEDVASHQRKFEFAVEETAKQGTALRNERALPLDEALKRVQRYEAHVSRQLEQAVRLLEKLQAERRAREDEPAAQAREVCEPAAACEPAAQAKGARPKTPTQAVRELIVEAIARRLKMPETADGEVSFGNSEDDAAGEAGADSSFGNPVVEPPQIPGVPEEFVRYFAGGRHNGASARPSPDAAP
jgi:hypothetical protein